MPLMRGKGNEIMNRLKLAAALVTALGLTVCLAGCMVKGDTGSTAAVDLTYDDSENYTIGGAQLNDTVEHIEIDWIAGNVKLLYSDSDMVSFSEESNKNLTDDFKLHYWLDGTTLKIRFCGSGHWSLGRLEKDLTVTVPKNFPLTNLKITSISANVSLEAIETESAFIETTSGIICLTGCTVTDRFEFETISGGLEAEFAEPLNELTGSTSSGAVAVTAPHIDRFKVSAASGSVSLSAEAEPQWLDIGTVSGTVDLTLPESASVTLDFRSTSGKLSSELSGRTEDGKYIFGDGAGEYRIKTVSGNAAVRKRSAV